MPPTRTSRIYWRNDRAYGDFRDFRDVGGRQEALIPPGPHSTRATKDPDEAALLASARLVELQELRKNKVLLGTGGPVYLDEYVERHLILKKQSGRVSDTHLSGLQGRLEAAIEFFQDRGPRDLSAISVADVQAWSERLAELPSHRWAVRPSEDHPGEKERVSAGTVRHYLNALSNLYTRAQSEGHVPPGFNPVASMMDKPTGSPAESDWLEVDEVALLLEAARVFVPPRKDPVARLVYPILATLALTGGRPGEIHGLDVEDVSFDRRTILIRPNAWRGVKTRKSRRSVRMWPQLEEILRAYVFGGKGPRSGPLFPATKGKKVQPVGSYRKTLDEVAATAGWKAGEVRPRMFRHTYAAARLQTLDRGAPVSPYTVGRELGHGGDALVQRVYGHLGEVRHRSEVVEYRIEQHRESERIRPRMEAIAGQLDREGEG